MTQPVSFLIIKNSQSIDATVEEVFQKALDPPVFYSPGMLRVFREITGDKVQLAVLKEGDNTIVALPIVKKKYWQNVYFDGWDNLEVLRCANSSDKQEQNFWSQLLKEIGFLKLVSYSSSCIGFTDVDDIQVATAVRRKCPYIALKSTWEEQNEVLSKKLVRNVRQYGNKALSAGITFTIKKSSELSLAEQREKLNTAFSFHKIRMESINQKSKFTPQQMAKYHESVLQNATNCFVIEARNSSGQTIAFYYGLMNRSRLSWFNGGYSSDYLNYSLGKLLVSELILYAMKNGIKTFDFLRGNESYKQKWTVLYNRNRDFYLSNDLLFNKLKLQWYFFGDTRKRIGSKMAFKALRNRTTSFDNIA